MIELFVRHRTAANLLMAATLIGGLMALMRLNTQFFPDFGIDIIAVTVEWPGAAAEDVDTNIIQSIEPEVRFVDGARKIRATSREGLANIAIEFDPGTDMQAALAEVETAVDQVRTLPEDAERPKVRRVVRYDSISRIIVSGPLSEFALKAVAKRMRDDLLARGIDKVDINGIREEEIWVEVKPETLLRLDLTLGDIARRIAATSQDIPSGDSGGTVERQIRSLGLRRDAAGVGAVEIRALDNGEKIFLEDVAEVREAFEEGGVTLRHNGYPAVELHVQRAPNASALKLAETVDAYLEEIRPTLPANLSVEQYAIMADLIRDRIDILLENGLTGLCLVILILFVFLNAPVAFWVAAGIPVALLATMVVMLATDQTINMVSLFGLIMALGIIVDDAIVVGEHAETQRRLGLPAEQAAIAGARRMATPVLSSSLTTVAAFMPLLLISDIIGEIISAIPITVVTVILASLVECFLILPSHLRWALARLPERPTRLRHWLDTRFERFRDGPFRRTILRCIEWRYLTVASALALFIMSVGLVVGGRIGFVFFPSPESDRIYANARMVAGTPRAGTDAMLDEMVRALDAAARKLAGDRPLVTVTLVQTGDSVGVMPGSYGVTGDHSGGMTVELIPSDQRDVRTGQLIAEWRREIRPQPGLDTLTIVSASSGPPGRDLDVRISASDLGALRSAADKLKAQLVRYAGVSEVEDDLPYGKQEAILGVTTRGRALGFATDSVGRQVRDAFEGAIAKRFPRDDEEVTVRVQFPRDILDAGILDGMYLRSPAGSEVALGEIVEFEDKIGFARIKREDGRRQVAVTAEIDSTVITLDQVREAVTRDLLSDLAGEHGVSFSFAGKAEEQSQTFGDMLYGVVIALVTIYVVLAWVFSSYARPLVVMSVIPLGFVGAAVGHYLLGFELTILSMVALLGLSGIVINDSIILVTTIDEHIKDGQPPRAAIVDGACARLRAVVLTSATTIGGLTPLIFETSLQAQFLVPMALTIVFGLMVTTFMVLLVVPALMAAQTDLAAWVGDRMGRGRPAAIR